MSPTNKSKTANSRHPSLDKENKNDLRSSMKKDNRSKYAGKINNKHNGNDNTSRSTSKQRLADLTGKLSNISNLIPSQLSPNSKIKAKNRYGKVEGLNESSDNSDNSAEKKIAEADYDIFYTYEEMSKVWDNSTDEFKRAENELEKTLELGTENYNLIENGLKKNQKHKSRINSSPERLARHKQEELLDRVITSAELRVRNDINREAYKEIADKINQKNTKIRLKTNGEYMDYEYDRYVD
jgi:hypothetical protein